jgi:hypothetical protein
MVGRELPNLRPNGEDHRGASGVIPQRATGAMMRLAGGIRGSVLWRSWTVMIWMHKALGWLLQREIGLLAIHFDSQG